MGNNNENNNGKLATENASVADGKKPSTASCMVKTYKAELSLFSKLPRAIAWALDRILFYPRNFAYDEVCMPSIKDTDKYFFNFVTLGEGAIWILVVIMAMVTIQQSSSVVTTAMTVYVWFGIPLAVIIIRDIEYRYFWCRGRAIYLGQTKQQAMNKS